MEAAESEREGGAVLCSAESLQLQLSQALAEIENIKAVATVSESTKQEAIDRVRRHCQEEVASLQTIMKESISSYETQLKSVEKERAQWRQYQDSKEREIAKLRRQLSGNIPQDNLENEMKKAQEDAEKLRSIVMPMELEIASLKQRLARAEEQLSADPSLPAPLPQRWEAESPWLDEPAGIRARPPREWGSDEGDGSTVADTFAANCTTWTTASGPAPCPGRPLPTGREDTASLLSTGTLVPESIYLPPPGHHLLLDEEWSELQQEVKQHKISLHQTREQLERESMVRKNLEEALRQSSDNCSHKIALLQEKVDSSALEVQRIREMFIQTQRRLQTQMVQLMATHKELCQRNRQLQRENQTLKELRTVNTQPQEALSPASGQGTGAPASLGQHSMEDIVGDLTQTAECSPDRSNELQTALQEKESELETLRTMYKQLNLELQARTEERTDLTGKLREEKAKGQRLQVELDTSEQVQRDFVKLSQALQVRLEQIRQADSMEAIRHILDSVSNLKDASQLQGAWEQGS